MLESPKEVSLSALGLGLEKRLCSTQTSRNISLLILYPNVSRTCSFLPLLSLCSVAQSCSTLCDPMDCSPPRLLCPWDFSGKNTGVGCHFLHQGIGCIMYLLILFVICFFPKECKFQKGRVFSLFFVLLYLQAPSSLDMLKKYVQNK